MMWIIHITKYFCNPGPIMLSYNQYYIIKLCCDKRALNWQNCDRISNLEKIYIHLMMHLEVDVDSEKKEIKENMGLVLNLIF